MALKITLGVLLFLSLLGNLTQEYFRRIQIGEDLRLKAELQESDMAEVDRLSAELELLQINRDLLLEKESLLDSIDGLHLKIDSLQN
ncbi:MAG: hypothetical protein MRY83_07110 [Flavobacteriales bacterium]|nr:hypothetical protein [Flavobacteriales bacterium]